MEHTPKSAFPLRSFDSSVSIRMTVRSNRQSGGVVTGGVANPLSLMPMVAPLALSVVDCAWPLRVYAGFMNCVCHVPDSVFNGFDESVSVREPVPPSGWVIEPAHVPVRPVCGAGGDGGVGGVGALGVELPHAAHRSANSRTIRLIGSLDYHTPR